ncbi:MAG: AMP-binding protein [Deltaproteobacteria bacterium]|nr:AMP-binding protein [Deltaproteobacteria bacterium]
MSESNSLELVLRISTELFGGSIVALAHPGWPAKVRGAAMALLDQYQPPRFRSGPGSRRAGAPATIIFTSGSGGKLKPVIHGLEQHRASAAASSVRVPFRPGDTWLLSLPLCHVSGLSLLFRAADQGGALVLPKPGESLDAALMRLCPSHVSLVAAQLSRILDGPAVEALARASTVLVGGGPVPRALVARARGLGIALRQTYGSTEMASQVATSAALAAEDCGAPLPGTSVRVEGERIWVRSPSAGLALVEGSGAVVPLTDAEGWWRSSDRGILREGRLTVLGRLDEVFISGGENVAPETIEVELLEHPDVETAIVVPVPDDRFGARPFAFVRARAGKELDLRALIRGLEHLPPFMRPVGAAPLPEEEGLKPSRARLRALVSR